MGHDLGHTPFGHAGEYILNEICSEGFSHYKQSVRIVEVLEKNGKGLNLTKEVRDGILNHRTSGNPSTMEGKVVRYSDKIAYINHDIDDAIRGKIIREEDIPREYSDILGRTVKERLDIMIHDIIYNSLDRPEIVMSPEVDKAMKALRQWMFENVYKNPAAKSEEGKAQQLIVPFVRILFGACGAFAGGIPDADGKTRREQRAGGLRLYCGHERQLCHRPV